MGSSESPSPYSIYTFSETSSDNATEEPPGILLSEFINKLSEVCYANSDESIIYVVDKASEELLYIYELEETLPSEK